MSILIKGMEMPTSCPICVVIDAAGQARRYDLNNDRYADNELFETVPVPAHGDLIDKQTVSQNLADVLNKKNPPFSYPDWNDAIVAMLTAPTIIPAEEGE